MKVLVTGGAGFIGSHIVDVLLKEGYEVVVIDNLSTGSLDYLKSNVPIYPVDICEEKVDSILATEKPEIIIHQAAQVDVPKSIQNPVQDARINIIGTINLLHAAIKYNVHKFIYASSCASYGEPLTDVIKEEHPTEPISLYGNSKYLGEHCVQVFHRIYGLEYTILRYANVYGPRQGSKGEGGVVSIFVKEMLSGEAPVIYGDGAQTRDFVYVKDVARANVLAIAKGAGKVMNISTGKATSINQLYKKIQKQIRFPVAPQYRSKRQGDIEHSRLDPTKAFKHLTWKPKYSLDKGLLETISYYSQ